MEQRDFRMPSTGESWRSHKGGLVTIIGMAHDDNGEPVVVETEYNWSLAQLPPIRVHKLTEFMRMIDVGTGRVELRPRFTFEREVGDDTRCPFIRTARGEEPRAE